MLYSRCNLPKALRCVVVFSAIAFVGCSDTCYFGFFNNGTGNVNVKAGNPPPACSLPQANAAMRIVALNSPVCESCPAAAQIEHVVVAVQSIQLRSSAIDNADDRDWLEIAPRLATEPVQLDLAGNSAPEILIENAIVPAGSYREARLKFSPDFSAVPERLSDKNACGEKRWNCTIMADGSVESLQWPGDVPELVIAIHGAESDSLMVLPDAQIEVQLSLEAHKMPYLSGKEGWKLQSVLLGHATVMRRWPSQPESSTPD